MDESTERAKLHLETTIQSNIQGRIREIEETKRSLITGISFIICFSIIGIVVYLIITHLK